MDVLDDSRLSQARDHFMEAQRRLEQSDADEAVDEARMAVEYAMLALLDATSIPRPERNQPNQLFDTLAPRDPSSPRAMSRDAEELVLAAPRFRGRTSAGHAGGAPVSAREAEAAVAAAAGALLYLAAQLP
jgi:HEPN domain-containing protein